MELELSLDPEDASRLTRLPMIAPLRSGRTRSRPVHIVWHDSADRALAQEGLALAEQRQQWRLERLLPNGHGWPPGGPVPVLGTARTPAGLSVSLPDPLAPIAAFDGRAASLSLTHEHEPLELTVLTGSLRAVAGEHRISRLHLKGPALPVEALALALAAETRTAVPCTSLAAQAAAVASGTAPLPRAEGPPQLPHGLTVADAFIYTVGHLTDVILHFAPGAASGREGPEPVHQMRVAVRRLRSAIKVFRKAVRCQAVDAADAGLKMLAAKLAPTRDWDVFLTETAAAVMEAFPSEQRMQRLLAAARRRQRDCHEDLRAFLDSADFRRLGIELACLCGDREWQATLGEPELAELAVSLEEFATRVLSKRLKKLQHADGDLAELEPAALHAIRLRAKRLRYAAEVFAPLFPPKAGHRFIRRLSRLQDRLGTLNDGAVAASLLHELGSGNHAFASGLVLGFIGAHGLRTRERIDRAWQKFHRLEAFWA